MFFLTIVPTFLDVGYLHFVLQIQEHNVHDFIVMCGYVEAVIRNTDLTREILPYGVCP